MSLSIKEMSERHVVTAGNYSFATAGQALFVHTGKSIVYNVLPGQGVVYTIEADGSTLTHDDTTIDATNIHSLFIGVGIDTNGNGSTSAIRHMGVENISGCRPTDASVSSPRCGAPQVTDLYFDLFGSIIAIVSDITVSLKLLDLIHTCASSDAKAHGSNVSSLSIVFFPFSFFVFTLISEDKWTLSL